MIDRFLATLGIYLSN